MSAATSGIALIALLAAAAPASAMALDPDEIAFTARLQQAVRDDDKRWIAAHLADPFFYLSDHFKGRKSRRWFLAHYGEAMSPRLKLVLLDKPPRMHGKAWQGAMIDAGHQSLTGPGGAPFKTGAYNVWIAHVGSVLKIITINNADLDRLPP